MRAFKKELTMFAVMIALAIITALLNPLFLGGDNLRNNLRHISLISLFALGEAMVIIAGGIDLSIGSIICVTAVSTSYLAMYGGVGIGAAVAISLAAALVVGVAQGTIIARLRAIDIWNCRFTTSRRQGRALLRPTKPSCRRSSISRVMRGIANC